MNYFKKLNGVRVLRHWLIRWWIAFGAVIRIFVCSISLLFPLMMASATLSTAPITAIPNWALNSSKSS